jgi:hypothetical protein
VALKKKLINIHNIRFGALTAVLVLSTVMLTTIDGSQNSVLAQNITSTLLPTQLPAQESTSTPAPETSGGNDEPSSSDDSGNNDDSIDGSSGSSGSDDDESSDDNDSQQSSSSDDSDVEDTSSSDVEEDEIEDESEQTNPLLEEIRNTVNGALSASGMPGPGF